MPLTININIQLFLATLKNIFFKGSEAMFIDITESNFNNTKENWENNAIKTYDIPLGTEDCCISGNDAIITLRLPHEDALYTDYASIMYWIQGDDGSVREESRAGLSVPSSCRMSVPIDDDDVSALFTSTVSGSTKGLAELRIHCDNTQALEALIAAPKAITYLRPMWYTGYGVDNALNPDILTPDNTVVMEDMRDALECSSLLEGRGQILNGKKYLFTFDENVYTWDYPYNDGTEVVGLPLSPSYYEIIPKDGTEDLTGGTNSGNSSLYFKDKLVYSTNGCVYVKMKRMNFSLGDSIGYAPDEIEDVLNGTVSEYFEDTDIFRSIFNLFETDEMININLRRNGLYLISGTLSFKKSNICIVGHGSQIRAWNPSCDGDGYYVLVGNSGISGVKNIELCDLTLQGLMRYENGAIVNAKEQCVSFNKMLFPTNMTFYEVNIDGFETGVHISNAMTYRDTPLNIRFIDCNVSRTKFGYNFKICKQVLVSGGSVDNSLSTDKMHHCVYVSTGSNYITVENCELKNSTGAAIHQMGGDKSTKMEHNHYHHLVIKNCFDGIVFGGYTLDSSAKHIRGEDIGNFLYLGNCGDVVVRDYVANQLESATITVGTGSEAHSFTNTDHYTLFTINNCVDALVEDSWFGDVPFSGDFSSCPGFVGTEKIKNMVSPEDYEDGWVEDNCAVANVLFRNCRFSHKSNKYSDIKTNSKSYQCFKFVFDKCAFSVYREAFIGEAVYIFNTSDYKQSRYVLRDCRAYYFVQNYDASESLGDGYFFYRKGGSLSFEGTYNISTSFDVPVGKNSQNVNNSFA